MQNQLNCSNIVLKSVKDVVEPKPKVGCRVPLEMEQICQMFNQNQNSSFNFDMLCVRKNLHIKTQQTDDHSQGKQAFFRRYAEINMGRDRVVEDNGFDFILLNNKAKSLNIKTQVKQSLHNFIPRNRFLALNKIIKLKSPKKLEPLIPSNNQKINTSLTLKKTDRVQQKISDLDFSLKKRRLVPLLSEKNRVSVMCNSPRADVSPQISSTPSSTLLKSLSSGQTPCLSQKKPDKNHEKNQLKKHRTLKLLFEKKQRAVIKTIEQEYNKRVIVENNVVGGHKKNHTPLQPWEIQVQGNDFQYLI